ncbi:quinon protein alcohol dehydrogenase-like superfamily [Rhizoctonia solani]|nr:quinon protein alcohol dehydrogenase-like superfamily [Rhizoctonia solani]
MSGNFKFSNLCGTVYRQGNIIFTSDGNAILSPVGNRVSVFDLVNNKSRTLSFENRKNISAIALSSNSNLLVSVDEDGRALLVNFRMGVVLHHFNFKKPVQAIKFSPDSKYIAVSHESHVQVWKTPNHLLREFAPFILHRTYTGHHDEVISIEWSKDSNFFLTTSRDMTARLFSLNPIEGFRPKTFAGHRDIVLNAYFSEDHRTVYTISRDGAVFVWREKADMQDDDESNSENASQKPRPSSESSLLHEIAQTRWGISERHYFNQNNTKVVCSTFHPHLNFLIVGFSTGFFGFWEMPSFNNVHTLSISQERISSVAINPSGEWIAFGAKKLGQLLVWEWQSESYVLKQQGHYFDMNTLSFSQDGQNIATGGDDGKVKVWNTRSGFCFVTFTEHTSAVSTVEFAKQGQILFTASLDGTVRAYDLVRYRNFRTFTSPSPVQFSSLAVDPSGEVVAAGSTDSFEVFMWSVQTGKLLDILTGHEGPISALAFSPTGSQLASASWDKSVRIWEVFGRSRAVEPFQLGSEALAVAFRPDGRELVATSLDGQVFFWDIGEGKQTNVIEARRDIAGGRKVGDRMTAANSSSGKSFNSVAYTADGKCIIAGGSSKYVVMYDVQEGVMVKKFQVSENLSLDGIQEFLDSRKLTSAGPEELIDIQGDESELEDRIDHSLPGTQRGDLSKRRSRQEARTKCVRFSPTGRSWAAVSTEGLLIYSLDDTIAFDPFDIDLDITPQSALEVLSTGDHLKALVMAFRLNEKPLLQKIFESIPSNDIHLISRQIPTVYLPSLLRFVGEHAESSPHMEFDLIWINSLLTTQGRYLRDHSSEYASTFRLLQKGMLDFQQSISRTCDDNSSTLRYLIDQSRIKNKDSEKSNHTLTMMDIMS